MSDSDYECSEDDETEFPPEIFGCTQETSRKDVPLMAPEFLSPVRSEVGMKEIEFNERVFAQSLAEDNLRANLIEKICTVIEEVP